MVDGVENNQNENLDEIAQEFLTAQLRGEDPELDEFVKQHPGLEEKIRQKVQNCKRISSLFDSLREIDESEFQHVTKDETDLIGTLLGAFKITEVIGRGGMGVVYQASDTRLDRSVAIKSLPPKLMNNATARARFMREAKLLASLSHPNIGVIHDIIEQADGRAYLVLEYIPGETLAERITKGPIKLQEALIIALQIAEAVETAHEHNVIHRDLKPGNIKITPDGRVKVLDFGLAKAHGGKAAARQSTVTLPGRLMGTPAYMSPEQARGKPTDKRSDIWSFGCVLYEMLTGRIPFEGETVSDTLANLLERDPNWKVLPESTSENIVVLLRRCLEKDPCRRLRDIGDAAIEINETLNVPAMAPPVTIPSISLKPETTSKANSQRIAMIIATIIIIVLSAIMVWFILEHRTQPPLEQIQQVSKLDVTIPEDISMDPRVVMTISPDGTYIAFLGQKAGVKQLYLRPLNQDEVVPVKGTDGAITVFFSHDSQWLGYATSTRLWKMALGGGQPIPICNVTGVYSAFWAQDDTIIFSSDQYMGLARVKASGGLPQLVSHRGPRELWHTDPEVLPGGKAVIFSTHDGAGSRGFQNIVIQSLVTGKRRTLLEGASFPRYASSGHLVYDSGEFMKARPFDIDTLTFTGLAVDIEGVKQGRFSRQGTLAWVPSVSQPELMLLWVDREGNETPVIDEKNQYISPRVSPDGNHLAFWMGAAGSHVWILDLQKGVMYPLTKNKTGNNFWCSWSPDGSQIAFTSSRSEENAGACNLYLKAADGSGPTVQLTEGVFIDNPISWTHDGKSIIFQRGYHPETGWDVMLLSLDGDYKPLPLLSSPANELRGELSPDGRWLAYVSTETGPPGVFVRPFQDLQRKWWRISPAGTSAGDPLWSPDGRELFYRDLYAEKIMVVEVETADEFTPGTPRILFDDCYLWHIFYGRNYDITPNGKRFVMLKEMSPPPRRIAVIHNWLEELKRLAPPRKE